MADETKDLVEALNANTQAVTKHTEELTTIRTTLVEIKGNTGETNAYFKNGFRQEILEAFRVCHGETVRGLTFIKYGLLGAGATLLVGMVTIIVMLVRGMP